MITKALQQLFVFLAVVTSMGTLVHDTRLNKVAETALPLSNLSIDVTSNLESLSHAASHTHVEETSAVSQISDGVPRMQTRDDHRRYLTPKYLTRANAFTGGSGYLWPSI